MTGHPRRYLPPLSALIAFEQAGTLLSFKRAATALALSPSAVSHQIKNLEDRLGVQLFARREGPTRLTEAGQAYLETISASLKAIETATRVLDGRRDDPQAELRVSVPPNFASVVMFPMLAELDGHGMRSRLHLETLQDHMEFDACAVDVAIRYVRPNPLGLKVTPLIDIYRTPVCSPRLARSLNTPADLERLPLIHVERDPSGWSAWLEDMGLGDMKPARDIWVDTLPAALEAAEHGLGVALAMDPLIRARKEFGRALVAPFADKSTRRTCYYLVCRPERADDKRIIAFRTWLQRAIDRLVGDLDRDAAA